MTKLIALGSKARIGKDFAAQELAKVFNLERIAFADELKKDIAAMVSKSGLNYWEIEKDPKQKEMVRPLLVEYGMTMRRFNENIWVNRALNGRNFNAEVTFITDCRFPNEAKRIKELGGYYIEVITETPPANETEALYSPLMEEQADYTVTNNFDRKFVPDLIELINTLKTTDQNLWTKTLSEKSKATSSTDENTNSYMLGPNLSFRPLNWQA